MKVKRSTGFLTITVLSAKGLKDVRHFGGLMGTYVTVRLSGQQQQATRKVTSGGGSPKWHEPFDFKLEGWKESMRPPAWLLDSDDEAGKFLVEIIHAGLLGQRVVGRRLVNEEDAVDLAQKGFTYHSFGLHGPHGEDVDGYVNLRLEFRPIERGGVKGVAGTTGVPKAVGEGGGGGGGGGVMDKKSGGIAGAAGASESNPVGEEDMPPSKLVSPGGTPLPSAAALWKPLNNKESSSDGTTRNSGGSFDFGEKKTGNGRKGGDRRSRGDGEIPLTGGWVTEGGGGGRGGGGLRNVRVGGGKGSAANNGSSNSSAGNAGNGRRFKPLRVHSSTLPFQHPKQVHPDTGSRPADTSNSKDEVGATTSVAQSADEDPDSTTTIRAAADEHPDSTTTSRAATDSLDLGWPMRKVVPPLTFKQQTGLAMVDAELPSPILTSGLAPPSSIFSPTTPTNDAPAGVNTPRGPKNHASLPRVLSHSSPSSEDYDFDPRTYYVAMPSDGKVPPPLYVSKFASNAPLEVMGNGRDERPSSARRHSTGGRGGGGGGGGGGSRHLQRRSLSLSRPSGLYSSSLYERRQQQVDATSAFSFAHPNPTLNLQSNEMGSVGGKYFDNIEAEDFPETGEGRVYEGPDSNPGERNGSDYGGEGEWGDDVAAFDHPYGYGNENNDNDFYVDEHPYSFAGTGSRRTGRAGSFGEFDRNDVLLSRSGPLLTTSSSKKLADFGKRRSKSIKESSRYRDGNPPKTRSAMAAALATFVRFVRPGSMKNGGGKVSSTR